MSWKTKSSLINEGEIVKISNSDIKSGLSSKEESLSYFSSSEIESSSSDSR